MDKVCRICSQDCSDKPRVRDRKGRYFCKACAMAHAKKPAAAEPAGPAPDDNPYTLDDSAPGASPLPIEMLDYVDRSPPCPACMHSMPPDAKVCIACGYHVEKGIQSSTLIQRKAGKRGSPAYACEHCGYDLTGLRSPTCPECGNRVNLSPKHRLHRDAATDQLREEYTKPAVWFAVGFVVTGIVLAIKGDPMAFVGYAILFAVQLPFMLAGLWLCQKTFLGDIGTPLLNLVRLAGGLALGNAVDTIIPLSFLFMTPGLIVFWGVLMDLFEIELREAVITGIIMGIVKIAGAIGIAYLIVGVLGWSIPF